MLRKKIILVVLLSLIAGTGVMASGGKGHVSHVEDLKEFPARKA